jgi:transcriptional regulator GlxA family with amidase domain
MAFAKGIRLNLAKQILSLPDAQTSVAGVAFSCGFANLGHFAKEYREAFGERPSETLARKMRKVAT